MVAIAVEQPHRLQVRGRVAGARPSAARCHDHANLRRGRYPRGDFDLVEDEPEHTIKVQLAFNE